MATHTERQRRIPDMKTFRRLLSLMNASGRVRRQVFKESDFYYIRKLYFPKLYAPCSNTINKIYKKLLAVSRRNEYTETRGHRSLSGPDQLNLHSKKEKSYAFFY